MPQGLIGLVGQLTQNDRDRSPALSMGTVRSSNFQAPLPLPFLPSFIPMTLPTNTNSLNSMELCVGAICGSIPTLRPLFATPTAKSSGTPREPDLYKRFGESPAHELTPIGGGRDGSFLTTNTTTTRGKHLSRLRSTSRERIIVLPSEQQRIRRTFEVEIKHEATTPGSSVEERTGQSHHGHDWNPV